MKIDTRRQSNKRVEWAQLPDSTQAGEAAKKGKQLRIDCHICDRRYFDLKSAIAAGKIKSEWLRSDIRKRFKCGKQRNSPCNIQTVAFEVHFQDAETFRSHRS